MTCISMICSASVWDNPVDNSYTVGCVCELAGQGERDARRLAEAVLGVLSRDLAHQATAA